MQQGHQMSAILLNFMEPDSLPNVKGLLQETIIDQILHIVNDLHACMHFYSL